MLGLSYQLPLNALQTLFVLPELQVYYPLNDIVSQNDWHIHQYRCGLSIRYSPFPHKDIHKTYKDITLIDTITISVKPPLLNLQEVFLHFLLIHSCHQIVSCI